jgi:mRNA-degrading endonuclease RelE of RelBE toxin-antitoxin system
MSILYRPTALKQLQKIPKQAQRSILNKIEMIGSDWTVGKMLKGELSGLRSFRSWPYRIIYIVGNGNVIIYSIEHRQSAYKR